MRTPSAVRDTDLLEGARSSRLSCAAAVGCDASRYSHASLCLTCIDTHRIYCQARTTRIPGVVQPAHFFRSVTKNHFFHFTRRESRLVIPFSAWPSLPTFVKHRNASHGLLNAYICPLPHHYPTHIYRLPNITTHFYPYNATNSNIFLHLKLVVHPLSLPGSRAKVGINLLHPNSNSLDFDSNPRTRKHDLLIHAK